MSGKGVSKGPPSKRQYRMQARARSTEATRRSSSTPSRWPSKSSSTTRSRLPRLPTGWGLDPDRDPSFPVQKEGLFAASGLPAHGGEDGGRPGASADREPGGDRQRPRRSLREVRRPDPADARPGGTRADVEEPGGPRPSLPPALVQTGLRPSARGTAGKGSRTSPCPVRHRHRHLRVEASAPRSRSQQATDQAGDAGDDRTADEGPLRPSRILAYTAPSRGNLFPLVPVLDELRGRGHQ